MRDALTDRDGPTDVVTRVADLAAACLKERERFPVYSPTYDFPIVVHSDYDALFSRQPREAISVPGLGRLALTHGRTVIHADGGSGKTSILAQLFRDAVESDILAVLIPLADWRPSLESSWKELADADLGRLNLLLTSIARPRTTLETLAAAAATKRVLLLVDGLNETSQGIGNNILSTLDSFTARNPRAGVVVTDRFSRRPIDTTSWILATIGPLYGEHGLRAIAFFRDHLGDATEPETITEAHRDFFISHGRLDSDELERAADAALAAYMLTSSRNFPIHYFAERSGDDVVTKLVEAGIVLVDGDSGRFQHHLYHDFLTSYVLARQPTMWKWGTFDAVSFRGSSFDSLAMTLEQLPTDAMCDELLRAIYDWNYYGAAYAIAHADSSHVRRETEGIITFALGERLWDPFAATVRQARDALQILDSGLARQILDLVGPEDLRTLASSWGAWEGTFAQWAEAFVLPEGADVSDDLVKAIRAPDSFIGWTLANTLKRVALTPDQMAWLRDRLADSDDVARWRIAHSLGGHGGEANVSALLGALVDERPHVRYGALRSLVETAARDRDDAHLVFDRLTSFFAEWADASSLLRALERFLILTVPPEYWREVVAPLVEGLWVAATTGEERDRWKLLADRITRTSDGASVA
jgi:hypothetical protein